MFVKRLLLATDFSPPAMHLIDCLGEFLALGLQEVVLLHVIDKQNPAQEEGQLENFAQETLDGIKARCQTLGLVARAITARGIPSTEIVAAARREEAEMILISPHSKGKIKEFFLGSTTASVVRISPVPVLIDKSFPTDPAAGQVQCFKIFQKVLVPLDFSPHSLALLEEIRSLMGLVEEVILLTVVEGDFTSDELVRTVENRQFLITARKSELDQTGFKVRTMVHQGSAAAEILAVSEKENITLIMLAARGEGLVKELILGSTANEVVRASTCPVLIFPSSELS